MRKGVLIVDDVDINIEIFMDMLQGRYNIFQAHSGAEAITIMREHFHEISVVLLDLIMPDLDGYDVLDFFRNEQWLENIPVFIVSAEQTNSTEQRCFEYGVFDYIRKPFDIEILSKRIDNAINLYTYKNNLEERVEHQTERLKINNKKLKEQAQQLRETARQLEKVNSRIISALGSVVESRDFESGEHIQRVKGYTRILANTLMKKYPDYGLTPEQVNMISTASALHDIGKISIPDSILLKKEKLTPEEYEQMKQHSYKGYLLLQNIKDIWSEEYAQISCDIAHYHHERYDGKGYPDGLKGDEIPISAQLVSLADVYDALVNVRCYKNAYTKNEAFDMIINEECGVFSPKLLECMKLSRKEFESLADEKVESLAG